MTPETEIGDFSKEDGENVSIPSVFEPLLHEIWPRFVNNLNANVTRVLRYDDFGQILVDMAKAESGRRWQEIQKKVEILENEKNIKIDFQELRDMFNGVSDIVVQYIKFGDSVYAEYVGVNLSIFLKNLAEKIPKFLDYNDRYEQNLKLRMMLFMLGSDLQSVNSIKIAKNFVSLMKNLDQKNDLEIAKKCILQKINGSTNGNGNMANTNTRLLQNLGEEEKSVLESEIEELKEILSS